MGLLSKVQGYLNLAGPKFYYYYGYGRFINIFDESNGKKIYQFYESNTPYKALYDNKLFLFTYGFIKCFNEAGDFKIWQNNGYGLAGEKTFYKNFMYVSSGDLYCFDVNTGQKLWTKIASHYEGFQNKVTIDPETGNIYTATFTGPVCFKNVP